MRTCPLLSTKHINRIHSNKSSPINNLTNSNLISSNLTNHSINNSSNNNITNISISHCPPRLRKTGASLRMYLHPYRHRDKAGTGDHVSIRTLSLRP